MVFIRWPIVPNASCSAAVNSRLSDLTGVAIGSKSCTSPGLMGCSPGFSMPTVLHQALAVFAVTPHILPRATKVAPGFTASKTILSSLGFGLAISHLLNFVSYLSQRLKPSKTISEDKYLICSCRKFNFLVLVDNPLSSDLWS